MQMATGYLVLAVGGSFALGIGVAFLLSKLFGLSLTKQFGKKFSLSAKGGEEALYKELSELDRKLEGIIGKETKYLIKKGVKFPEPGKGPNPLLNLYTARRILGDARAECDRVKMGESIDDLKKYLLDADQTLDYAQKTRTEIRTTWKEVVKLRKEIFDLYKRLNPTD